MRENEKPPPRPGGDGLGIEQRSGRTPLDGKHSGRRFRFNLVEVWAEDLDEAVHGPRLPRERLRRLARSIHALGERPLYELFVELAAGRPVVERLEKYASLADLAWFIEAFDGRGLSIARPVRGDRR